MEGNERSNEAALFFESSDDENSIQIVPSPRLSQKIGPQRRNKNMASTSSQSSKMLQERDVKFKYPTSPPILSDPSAYHDLSLEAAVDSEFAELDAWLHSGSAEIV